MQCNTHSIPFRTSLECLIDFLCVRLSSTGAPRSAYTRTHIPHAARPRRRINSACKVCAYEHVYKHTYTHTHDSCCWQNVAKAENSSCSNSYNSIRQSHERANRNSSQTKSNEQKAGTDPWKGERKKSINADILCIMVTPAAAATAAALRAGTQGDYVMWAISM